MLDCLDDPCAGYDYDSRSPYYVDRTPYTGDRCLLCGGRIREDEEILDDGDADIHYECLCEMPVTFTLARLGWKKTARTDGVCALCGEIFDDDAYEKDGKIIHLSCFTEQDKDDHFFEALGLNHQ
jgi:hypothetical protein